MLSYRHAFHAGNFADVLKHLILVECLNYLKQKDKPFVYYDTHSGPGLYQLDSEFAQKNREYENGITQLWDAPALPELVQTYRELVEAINTGDTLQQYPGSPVIAEQLLREQDRLLLCELHGTEAEALDNYFKFDKRAQVWQADGLERAEKLLPPKERRGIVLIDPSYELKEDYQRVVHFLKTAHRKFAQGIYLLWYPVVERTRIEQMERELQESGIRNIQLSELGIEADTQARGMTSSGIIAINAPWTLKSKMQPALEFLAPKLESTNAGYFRCEQLVDE